VTQTLFAFFALFDHLALSALSQFIMCIMRIMDIMRIMRIMQTVTLISSPLNADFVDSDDDDLRNTVHPPEQNGALPDVDQPPPSPPAVPNLPNAAAAIPPPDMRRTMAAVGGPNYTNALQEADARTGQAPLNIPFERCGGESRRQLLKRRAHDITRSTAEIFAYCTSRTTSIQDTGEILSAFGNVIACNLTFGLH
jgi:hypothetical protein